MKPARIGRALGICAVTAAAIGTDPEEGAQRRKGSAITVYTRTN